MGHLAALPGSESLFNPYDDADPGGAARRANLRRYLADMLQRRPRAVLVFEAPGYRGCRFSGIPVTSERIMIRGIAKWGLFGAGYQATSGQPDGMAEMTATILWQALVEFAETPPVIWNTVPLHPHQTGAPLSNRPPTLTEQRAGGETIHLMLELFQPAQVLAIGRVAQRALTEMNVQSCPLRHPSQGGKPEFLRGLRAALDTTTSPLTGSSL